MASQSLHGHAVLLDMVPDKGNPAAGCCGTSLAPDFCNVDFCVGTNGAHELNWHCLLWRHDNLCNEDSRTNVEA